MTSRIFVRLCATLLALTPSSAVVAQTPPGPPSGPSGELIPISLEPQTLIIHRRLRVERDLELEPFASVMAETLFRANPVALNSADVSNQPLYSNRTQQETWKLRFGENSNFPVQATYAFNGTLDSINGGFANRQTHIVELLDPFAPDVVPSVSWDLLHAFCEPQVPSAGWFMAGAKFYDPLSMAQKLEFYRYDFVGQQWALVSTVDLAVDEAVSGLESISGGVLIGVDDDFIGGLDPGVVGCRLRARLTFVNPADGAETVLTDEIDVPLWFVF